ncbi:MAG: hypothetical protein ACOCV3_07240 [Halanaerobiales bacterium]
MKKAELIMLKNNELILTILVLFLSLFFLVGNAAAQEVIVGSFDKLEVMKRGPGIELEELAEIGEDLGYDHLIEDQKLEVFEDGESDEVMDILGEDVTEAVEDSDEIDEVTIDLLIKVAPESLQVGVFDMEAVMEEESDLDMDQLEEIGSELGYDILIWEARLEIFEDGEIDQVADINEKEVTEVLEEVEPEDITEEIIDEL